MVATAIIRAVERLAGTPVTAEANVAGSLWCLPPRPGGGTDAVGAREQQHHPQGDQDQAARGDGACPGGRCRRR